VRQWWRVRTSDDLEEFVELIPYEETRNFVKRVMTALEEYRRIYPDWSRALTDPPRP
jgi:soluble lytic murein transglycosylase-like protein